jgi:hypothetical protein
MTEERDEEREARLLAQREVLAELYWFLPDAEDVLEDLGLDAVRRAPGLPIERFRVPSEESLLRALFQPRAAPIVPPEAPGLTIPGVFSLHREAGHLVAHVRREQPTRRASGAKLVVRGGGGTWVFDVRIGQQTPLDTVVVLGTDDEVFELLRPVREALSPDERERAEVDLVLTFDDDDPAPR